MIAVDNIGYRYRGAAAAALTQVSVGFSPGTLTAVVGANGSGKTTLLGHLNGLLRPEVGRVLLDGVDITGVRTARLAHRVALIGSDPHLQLLRASVRAEVGLGLPLQARDRIDAEMKRCGLNDLADAHPHELGRGTQTLVLLAAALVRRPQVVVLDEPTAAMDGAQLDRLAGVLTELGAGGTTVVLATHDLDFATESCAEVLALEAGRVRYHGPVAALVDPHGPLGPLAEEVELTGLSSACGLVPAAITVAEAVGRLSRR